jgi:urea transport system permease protein
MMRLIARLCLAGVLTFGLAVAAQAQNLDAIFDKFLTDSYSDTDAAITALAASGAPIAPVVVEALADGRLGFSEAEKRVVVTSKDGKSFDAKTGSPVAAVPADLKPVRLNNRVRRAIEAATGSLTLLSSDPGRRFQAAEAVFKARDATALATVEQAIEKEQFSSIKKALIEARAAIRLTSSDTSDSDKVAAVEIIEKRGDQDAVGLLRSVAVGASPIVKLAAETAISGIERRLSLLTNARDAWYGISLGSVLLLAAIGLAITFGVMGVINMAHGEMVMLGAYTTFVVQEFCRAHFPEQIYPNALGWTLPIAIPLAFIVTALVGVLIERGIIRFLYARPLDTLLATWGVSLILQQAVREQFGPNNRNVASPSYMSSNFDLGGVSITYGRMWIVVFAIALFAALVFVLRVTPFGLKMRAVTQNRRMAAAMGIRTPWIDTMAFALGSGIAGIAGVALSQIDNVSPNLGQNYIIDSFLVVVFGGVGNLWGTLVAALSLGVVNKFLEPYAGAVLGKIVVLIFIILFIQKRPRGLFPQKGRAAEA